MDTHEPYEVRLVEDRWATLRHIVEAAAIIAAGIWAFYTFVYQEKIKPGNEPAALNLTMAIASLGHDSVRDYISFTIVLRNTGKTEIDVAADAYNVWGDRYGAQPAVRRQVRPETRIYQADIPIASRRLVASQAELRDAAVGGKRNVHMIIEPDAAQTLTNVIAVPRHAYDAIHAQVFAVPVKTGSTRVPVTIIEQRIGGYSLHTKLPTFEDDQSTDFVLPH